VSPGVGQQQRQTPTGPLPPERAKGCEGSVKGTRWEGSSYRYAKRRKRGKKDFRAPFRSRFKNFHQLNKNSGGKRYENHRIRHQRRRKQQTTEKTRLKKTDGNITPMGGQLGRIHSSGLWRKGENGSSRGGTNPRRDLQPWLIKTPSNDGEGGGGGGGGQL